MRIPMVAGQLKDADWEQDITCDRWVAKDSVVHSQNRYRALGRYWLHRKRTRVARGRSGSNCDFAAPAKYNRSFLEPDIGRVIGALDFVDRITEGMDARRAKTRPGRGFSVADSPVPKGDAQLRRRDQ
jgi:hypothetical protein